MSGNLCVALETPRVEPLDDSHYLEPPDERWCDRHEHTLPCPTCRAEYQEWQGEMKRETR